MIALVGHHASGKTEVARLLVQQFDCLHFETSTIVRSNKANTAPELPMTTWVEQKLQNEGPDAINRVILDAIEAELTRLAFTGLTYKDIVITGNRQLSGVQYLWQGLQGHELLPRSEMTIIGMHVEVPTLYARYVRRGRAEADRTMTREAFDRLLESESGLTELMREADQILDNTPDDPDRLASVVTAHFSPWFQEEAR